MARASSPRLIDTIVIGAGQAGLMMSYYLGRAGREHLLLDGRRRLGGSWRDRWDDFCLVTPNWSASMPGYPYDGPDPDGFMPRDEIAGRMVEYATIIQAPVMLGTHVTRLGRDDVRNRFVLDTSEGRMAARHVVVATGPFRTPRIPAAGAGLSPRINQLHSFDYRNDAQLPPGAVLLVGSGQTGVQLAEELIDNGRRVFLAVGSAPRTRRRYRGRDGFRWLVQLRKTGARYGIDFPTAATLPSPALRLGALPQLTGHKGGAHEVDLRKMAKEDGLTLLGRLESIDGRTARFADDLAMNLARSEAAFDLRTRPMIDRYVEAAALDVPPGDDLPPTAYEPPSIRELDLTAAGITSVMWASGFSPSLEWIDLPILDEWGLPKLDSVGRADVPGLYFLGMPWQSSMLSASIPGTVFDSAAIAASMGIADPETSDELLVAG